MAKTPKIVEKTYPDLSGLFAKKEEARRERAKLSPKEKLEIVERQNRMHLLFKSAKIVKKGGVE